VVTRRLVIIDDLSNMTHESGNDSSNEIERLHLSRLSNYSENGTQSNSQINDLNTIEETSDEVTHFSISLSESSLSNAADSVVRNVLHKIGSEWDNQQRIISPFPSTGNVTTHNAVAPTQKYFNEFQYDISSSSISGSENGNDEQPDDSSQPHPGSAPVKSDPAQDGPSENEPEVNRSLVRTSVSLDRVEKILAEKKEELSTSSSDDEKDENSQKPKSAKSLTSRPRSASVSRLDDKTANLREFVDLPNGKPLTERRRISQRNSEAELTNMFGPGHELSIFVGTWNLNLSTNVDPDSLRKFLIERNQTKCDIYVFGSQEIPVESVIEWEIMIQRCLGRKYILLHAVRFGTLHLTLFIKSHIQSYCSAVDWGVLSVRAISTIKTKGVAACTVQIFGTKFIFLTSHLTVSHMSHITVYFDDVIITYESYITLRLEKERRI
jgi:hypothetical protein